MKETMLNCFESWKMSNQWYANEICGKKKSCTIEICHKLSFSPCTGRPTLGDHFFFFLELLVYLNYWNNDRIWNELRLSLKRSESRIKLSRPLSVAKKKKGKERKKKNTAPPTKLVPLSKVCCLRFFCSYDRNPTIHNTFMICLKNRINGPIDLQGLKTV